MVDFQERDTRRGLGGGEERSSEHGDGDDEDGEAEIDEVRQQLEEPPSDEDEGREGGPADADDTGEDDQPAGSDDGGHAHGTDDDREADDGHDHHGTDVETLGAAVVTISSSRTMDDDPSGDAIVSSLVDAGHDVVTRELIADDYDGIQHTFDTLVRRSDVDVVVATGGTGVTPDDETVEAVRPLFEKELPGFGELFRTLSYDDVGTRIVGTRATAGVADGVPVFCLPGSTDAVRLGVEEIVVDVAPHLAGLTARDETHRHQQTLD